MRYRFVWLGLALGAVWMLHPAANDTIRGFDPASQAEEVKWEEQARAVPEAARVGRFIEKLADKPHLAGTPQSKETAEYILGQLKEYGLDAHIETFEALTPTPAARSLEMTEPTKFRAKLEEPAVPGDKNSADKGQIPTFNAYSGDGDVTAPVVYVNYGVPDDYKYLADHGIDVKGKIVIARYGGSWRGIKPKVAQEHGAAACLIYSDPKDDGYYQGDIYPKGAYRPPDGVQRGSVMDLPQQTGDPQTPGFAGEVGGKTIPLSEVTTMMKIPVMPISYADAQPLLANLGGPVAPESWRGALPITYHLGPGATKAHFKLTMNNSRHPLYDVIVRIPGSEYPDQWLLYGNHHDAWVHGASDPLSGAAPLLETARALSELTKKGWKPKRTIMLAFWDGEEYGLLGSTEFMEKHTDELNVKLVMYLNGDSNAKGWLNASGSHTLESFAQEVARDVKDPDTGKSVLEAMLARPRGRGDQPAVREFRLSPLGSGSDYTPFLQHVGIATLDMGFGGAGGGGVYHSDYDDYYWYSHFGDPTFVYGKALAEFNSTLLLRMADAPLLPFEFTHFASTMNRYLSEIEALPQTRKADLADVHKELSSIDASAKAYDAAYGRAIAKLGSVGKDKLAALNQTLYQTERSLMLEKGLPRRPWYRHSLYAPGMYTGYAVKTLPGVREAVEQGTLDEADQQAKLLAGALHAFNAEVQKAIRQIEAL